MMLNYKINKDNSFQFYYDQTTQTRKIVQIPAKSKDFACQADQANITKDFQALMGLEAERSWQSLKIAKKF